MSIKLGLPVANMTTKPCVLWISVTLRSPRGCVEYNRTCVVSCSIQIYLVIFYLEVWGPLAWGSEESDIQTGLF